MLNRKILARYCVIGFSFLVIGCSNSNGDSQQSCSDDVCYRVTFSEVWNAGNFPTQFPANSHFSSLIGARHGPASDFFELNQSASAGIESMAETGSTSALRREIENAVTSGTALGLIEGDDIPNTDTSVRVEFSVNDAFPLVTLVSMVAPSPDWFVGVDSVSLKDVNGEFYDSLVVSLEVYDSGTDSGVSFTSANADDNSVVTKLSCTDLVNDCGFTNGLGTDGVEFIGTFLFERIR